MTTETRNALIGEFAAWLQDAEGFPKDRADREAWDFAAGAYSEGDTLEDLQDAWADRN